MKKMFLDIETIPANKEKESVIKEIFERKKAKGNKTLGTFEEYLDATGLDGAFGRICCICYAVDDKEVVALWGEEKQILEDFWKAAAKIDLFVGFNLMDFDLRFIYQRSVVWNVKPTQELDFTKGKNSPIYDVMWEWSRWSNLGRTSLHGLAKALGLPSPKEGEIEGKDVAKAYAQGRIREICEYCKGDVEATRLAYKRLTFN